MKAKILIVSLLLCLNSFGQKLPITGLCLSDIIGVTGGTCLGDAFTNANSSYFDVSYAIGGANWMSEFRNYGPSATTIPTVTTTAITSITTTTATGGGNITAYGGAIITARGVCWSTSINPTTANSHTSDGTGIGSFVSYLTPLAPSNFFYVRAYATNLYGTAYGDNVIFTTNGPPPTYSFSTSIADGAEITECTTITFSLVTTNVPDGVRFSLFCNEDNALTGRFAYVTSTGLVFPNRNDIEMIINSNQSSITVRYIPNRVINSRTYSSFHLQLSLDNMWSVPSGYEPPVYSRVYNLSDAHALDNSEYWSTWDAYWNNYNNQNWDWPAYSGTPSFSFVYEADWGTGTSGTSHTLAINSCSGMNEVESISLFNTTVVPGSSYATPISWQNVKTWNYADFGDNPILTAEESMVDNPYNIRAGYKYGYAVLITDIYGNGYMFNTGETACRVYKGFTLCYYEIEYNVMFPGTYSAMIGLNVYTNLQYYQTGTVRAHNAETSILLGQSVHDFEFSSPVGPITFENNVRESSEIPQANYHLAEMEGNPIYFELTGSLFLKMYRGERLKIFFPIGTNGNGTPGLTEPIHIYEGSDNLFYLYQW